MFEAAELGQKLDKQSFAEREPRIREALLDAQFRVRDAGFRVVIVIAGAEGAGKGDTVNLLLEWMDARGIETHALGLPSYEESVRPPYFRFWRRLPPAGRCAIFFGSWYTEPIVEHSLGKIDDAELDLRLDRIVDFERMLVDEGTLLLKFWLHVTKKQQKKRFKKLEADPDTAWRVTKRDWEFHETYDAFIDTASHALRVTSTAGAPWQVIEAHDRRFRHVSVAERVLAALERRLAVPRRPDPPPQPLPRPAELNLLRALDLGQSIGADEYEKRKDRLQGRLGRLSRRMTAQRCAAVLVFEGVDAAGKGGSIRRITHALDARFYRVIPISAPSDEELARPYLWRFWRNVPALGHFAIFDRSWYGRVLVERVEGFAAPDAWRRAYREINAFEEQLVDAGVLVVKFWLQISREEQLRRFEDRRTTGYKRHKITDEDWRNREKWDAYEACACEMIERTSTEIAPWTLVPSEDKRFGRIRVLETVCDRLEAKLGA